MGEGTVSLEPQQIEAEISALREELGALVGELDRRRHELLDVRLQLRRHAWQIAVAGVGVSVGIAGLIWLGVARARRRRGLLAKASRLREGVARMVDRPERVAAEQTVVGKLLTAAATAAVATAATKAVERAVLAAVNWSSAPSAYEPRPQERRQKAA
jgi:hypothetical protein